MDQVKIGRLIARLRKAKNLTQQELGDIMGVGHQAVSKWERGNCLPDISIINKLCEVLDITSDELLKGELNDEHKIYFSESNHTKYLWLLPVLIIVIILGVILIINKTKEPSNVYVLERIGTGYHIDGQIVKTDDDLTIFINTVEIDDRELRETIIKNYQYELLSGDTLVYGFGHIKDSEFLDEPIEIRTFLKTFKVEYRSVESNINSKIKDNNLVLRFTFLTENDEIITKDIKMKVNSPNK